MMSFAIKTVMTVMTVIIAQPVRLQSASKEVTSYKSCSEHAPTEILIGLRTFDCVLKTTFVYEHIQIV